MNKTNIVQSKNIDNRQGFAAMRRSKYIENSIIYFILISLFCVNFLGRGSIFCLLFSIYAVIKIKFFIFDLNCLVVLLLSLSVTITSLIYGDIFEAAKGINFFLMYLIGFNGFQRAQNKDKYIQKTALFVFWGFFIYIILTYYININITLEYEGQRRLINFWTGEEIAVTLVGLVSSVVIGYSVFILFCIEKFYMKLIAILALFLVVVINAKTATRTPFFLLGLVFVFMFLVNLKSQKQNKKIKILFFTWLLICVLFCLIANNIGGVKTYIDKTPIMQRFLREGDKTSRTTIFKNFLDYTFVYPWGGGKIQEVVGIMAHNYLQQGHDLYGIFATIALIGITISVFKNFFRLIKKRNKKNNDYMLLAMYFSMFIQMCLEPIFKGYPCFFFSFLLIHGATTGYVNNNWSKNENC